MISWEYYCATWASGTFGWKWSTDELRKLKFYEALDGLGEQGWELVTAVPLLKDGRTEEVEYLFKRPKH